MTRAMIVPLSKGENLDNRIDLGGKGAGRWTYFRLGPTESEVSWVHGFGTQKKFL